MKVTDFTDERIAQVDAGSPLSPAEREFLAIFTARFEECEHDEGALAAMPDRELMNTAYGVWADYARGQIQY